jgi:dienelactone hydrolase
MRHPALSLLYILVLAVGCASIPVIEPVIIAPATLISGDDAGIKLVGLRPGERVSLHSVRTGRQTVEKNGAFSQVDVIAHAWARFRADSEGQVNVSQSAPDSGTYREADFNGMFWSGFPEAEASRIGMISAAAISDGPPASGEVRFGLERDGEIVARHTMKLRAYSERIQFKSIAVGDALPNGDEAQVSGVFAAPAGATSLPSLILLHGSEGYSAAAAQAWAGRMAERGFAAFALAYVAYPRMQGVPGVQEAFVNVPIETIAKARDVLATRPEADSTRLGVYGISKGAEFSLVAASRYSWIRAIVACVPSDAVWAGFGGPAPEGTENSSWSWAGAPLPAIPYDRYEDVFSGAATAAQVHVRSRAALTPDQDARVRIPVERIEAKVLLIGAGADEVWPSLDMAKAIEARMQQAGRGSAVRTLLYPGSGHGSCGTGTTLQRIDPEGDPAAMGLANTQAYQGTIDFLQETLR